MEEDEGERKVCEEEDAERIPDEDRTAQLSKQILAQFAFAQAQPKKKMRGVEKEKKEKMRGVEKEKKEKMRGVEKKEKKEKMRGVEKKEKKEKSSASRGRARGVANSGSVVAVARKGTASSSGTTTAARRKKRKSTEDDDADDLVVEPQGIIKDELEEDEGLLWEEVEFEQPRSNESEGRNDNAADDHAEDQGDDNDDDDDAFLVPAQPATKSSAKARQRKPKAVEPKQESRKSAGPAALSTDLQNLIMKGKQKRKRNESKKDKKEQTSRQQQAEKRQRKEKQQMAVEVHKTHLLCLLAHHYHTNTQLEDELLQSTLLSLVPSDLWILHPNVGHEPDLKKRLRELMKWFRATFEIDNAALAEERAAEEAEAAALEKKGAAEWKKEAHESRFGVLPDRLMRVIEQKKGTPTQIAQLFVSLCRTLSLTTRYVAVLDPITFKTATPRKPPQRPAASSKGKSKSSKSLFDEDEGEDEEQESRGGKGKRKRTQAPAPRKRQSPAKKEVDEEGNEEGDEAEDDFLTLVPSLMPRFAYSPTDDSDPAKPRPTTTSSTSAGTSPSAAAAGAGGRLTPSPSKRPRRTTPTTTPSPLTSPPLSTSTSATPTAKRLQGGIPRDMPSLWAEIYYPRETRWIHVDIVRNAVDQPQYYEETYPSIQLAYVASLAEGSLSVRDVTRRYTSRWSEVTQRRMPEPDWWHQTLSVISRPTEAMLDQNAYDESEQKGRELTEQMPTTLSAFKTHPLYCLERFVHKYEALYPRGPVLGEFKGQPIYPRSCVRKLHTKDKWIQKARAVREDEVPIKRVRKIIKKKTKKKGNGRDEKDQEEEAASQSLFNDDNEDEAEEDPNVPPEERDPISSKKRKGKGKAGDDDPDNYVDLYGKWQTEDYVPPMALDGVVPKNEFGNIYLFKPSMLPVGAAHVKYPNACTIARRINVDCAPAMVGWRWAGARSVPEIEGVVVCEEYASLIEELCQEELERKFQAELEKRRKAVAERWKRMAKKLIVKQHLRDKYEAQQHEQGQGQGQVLLDVTQESGEEKEKAKELTITVDKAQLESRRRGVELNHTHAFGEERCVDPDEDLWEKTCSQCGFVLAFEKM